LVSYSSTIAMMHGPIYIRFTNIMFNKFFFFEKPVDYEIMWKNIVQPERPQMTIQRMRIASWMPKAIYIHIQKM